MKMDCDINVKTDAKQIGRYTMVGVSSSLIEYAAYSLVFSLTHNYYFGNVAGFIFSVLNSFIGNRHFVFKGHEMMPWWKALLRTYLIFMVTGLVGANILSHIFIEHCGISPYLSPIMNFLILSPINFLLNKYWVCSPYPKDDEEGKQKSTIQ